MKLSHLYKNFRLILVMLSQFIHITYMYCAAVENSMFSNFFFLFFFCIEKAAARLL